VSVQYPDKKGTLYNAMLTADPATRTSYLHDWFSTRGYVSPLSRIR
jgi:hypothetical protein